MLSTWLRIFLLLVSTILTGVAQSLPEIAPFQQWHQEKIGNGISLRQQQFTNLFGDPQFIHLLVVEPEVAKRHVRFAAAHQFGSKEMLLPELAEKADALAAINGGFFDETTNANCGILKIDGKILPFTKWESDDLYFVGGSAIGIDRLNQFHFYIRTNRIWFNDWKPMRHALAGGHPLIINGNIFPQVEREDYDARRELRHAGGKNPRTAFGITTNQVVLLVTVDGRHPGEAEGITAKQLAELMKSWGCRNAINLDGGGSTTLWIRGRGIVNHPCDNQRFDTAGARMIRTAVILTD